MEKKCVLVIGGGAAGFFGAIACATASPDTKVIILEKNRQLLSKVRISGGGRCNVTHACFDPKTLINFYPRGGKALLGPFSRFQPKDTVEWFEKRGVMLKKENDGRMFPVTDNSETIINCLMKEAQAREVEIRTEQHVSNIKVVDGEFHVEIEKSEPIVCQKLLMATGSSPKVYTWMQSLGHTVEPQVPSLFTFNVPDSPLLDIAGISVSKVKLTIAETKLEQIGPILMTHWGFSGPAVLKLSAWGARILHSMNYKANLRINWLPDVSQQDILQILNSFKSENPNRQITTDSPFELPKQLWKKLVAKAGIDEEKRLSALSKKDILELENILHRDSYNIDGKSTYKEEFVTCGGINLDEVDFKTMESRKCPNLYFAGEILDIDGVTGGFNFQNAWTTSWIAGKSISEKNSCQNSPEMG